MGCRQHLLRHALERLARTAHGRVAAPSQESRRDAAIFAGRARRDPLRCGAAAARAGGRRASFFRLAVVREGDRARLVLARTYPDLTALEPPQFAPDADRSVLTTASPARHLTYFGRDANASDTDTPSWRNRWDDPQRLPLLVKIEVRPEKGTASPTLIVDESGVPRVRLRGLRCAAWPLRGDRMMRARASTQSGIALITVLWLTIMLTVIASGFAFSMRNEVLAARNALSLAQARAAADGAIERTPSNCRARATRRCLAARRRAARGTTATSTITTRVDESAQDRRQHRARSAAQGLFEHVGGAIPTSARRDRRRRSRTGATPTTSSGRTARRQRTIGRGPDAQARNGSFETVSELARVLGVTPAIYARIADSLTVYSRQPGINPATASRDVLLALPNVDAGAVDAYLAAARDALANKLPVPPFPPATGFAARRGADVAHPRAWRRMPDGVTFVRDAVLRPSGRSRRPVVAFLWQEGARPPTPPAPAGAAAASSASGTWKTMPRRLADLRRRCAISRSASDSPRSGAGGRESSAPLVPARLARRRQAAAHAPGPRVRSATPPCCGSRARPTARWRSPRPRAFRSPAIRRSCSRPDAPRSTGCRRCP